MRYPIIILSIFMFSKSFAQEDYTIKINGNPMKISLDKKYEVVVDGKKVVFEINANDTLIYNDKFISFKYPKGFNVSQSKIEEGIEQVMIASADGTGIIIQRYADFNPENLNEFMLKEVTKESVTYGFALKREDYKKTFKSGQKVDINKAVLNYKDETNIYEIMSVGKKDEGVLILTMKMDNAMDSAGQKLINLMWETLILK